MFFSESLAFSNNTTVRKIYKQEKNKLYDCSFECHKLHLFEQA